MTEQTGRHRKLELLDVQVIQDDTPEPIPAKKMPEVIRMGSLDIQVCVPENWVDDQVKEFADREIVCGTVLGWQVRKAGDKLLMGCSERVPCAERRGFVHIMLDA